MLNTSISNTSNRTKALKHRMTKATKFTKMFRNRFLFVMLLFGPAISTAAADGADRGVLGFLRGLEEHLQSRTYWFYQFFGSRMEKEKFNLAKECEQNPVLFSREFQSQACRKPKSKLALWWR
jgi:hypothetical protein